MIHTYKKRVCVLGNANTKKLFFCHVTINQGGIRSSLVGDTGEQLIGLW